MIKKLKEEIKFYKKHPFEFIIAILPIIIAIVLLIPVPYTYTLGGGVIKLDKKIELENGYNYKGSLNATYVAESKGNVALFLASKVFNIEEEKQEKEKSDTSRGRLFFDNSLDNAVMVAYSYANKGITINDVSYYVMAISDEAKTTLKVGDKLLEIEGEKITSLEQIKNYISKKDKISIKVLRGKEEIETSSEVINLDNQKYLGISIISDYDYDLDNDIKFKFNNKEEGSSGGLMLSLTIYNKLVKEDITKGKNIAGTGTIGLDGAVGEIAGVKYKLRGAVKNKADIFLVPSGNYDEAIKEKKLNNYKIKIISVDTFKDAVEKLKNV